MTTEELIDSIDFSELEKQYQVHEDYSLDHIVVVDGIPAVDASKQDKLLDKLSSTLFRDKFSIKKENIFIPCNDKNVMKGCMIVELSSAAEAEAFIQTADGFILDKDHKFTALRISEFDNFLNSPNEIAEYKTPVFQEREHYREWLTDAACRDQFALIEKEKLSVYWNNRTEPPELAYAAEGIMENPVKWSPSGTFLARYNQKEIDILCGKSFGKLITLNHSKVKHIDYSPCERYILTYSPVMEHGKNLFIWELQTGKLLQSFPLDDKSAQPPYMKWSGTGDYIARLSGDSLFIFELPQMSLLDKKSIKIENIKEFEWSPNSNVMSYWISEVENSPARVTLWDVSSRKILRTKNLFNVDNCRQYWNESGAYLGVVVERLNKAKKPLCTNFELFRILEKDIPIDVLEFKGKVQAFQWEPHGTKFSFVHTEEAKTLITLFDMEKVVDGVKQAQLVKSLERKGVNKMLWCPRGKFLILGVLHCISATIEFWNTREMELMSIGEHIMATDIAWDPSGRFLVSYVSFWKYQVENGFYIWDFKGQLLYKRHSDKLMQFSWRPRPATLLSEAQVKEIKRHLKEYSKLFDEADSHEMNKSTREEAAKRQQIMDAWNAWKQLKHQEYQNNLSLRISLLKTELNDSTELDTIEEWIEEVIEETEEVIE